MFAYQVFAKYLAAFAIAGLASIPVISQTLPGQAAFNKTKGTVKIGRYLREYLIDNGRPTIPKRIVISETEYDRSGRMVRYSDYGNFERRYIFGHVGEKQSTEIQYFDLSGRRIPAAPVNFEPKADIAIVDDLCSVFSERTELNKQADIKRIIETCNETGEVRSTTTIEGKRLTSYYKEVREDAKGRVYEYVYVCDKEGHPVEQRVTVDDRRTPKYHWYVTYVNHKFDVFGNLIEATSTVMHSSRPNQVVYQTLEKFEFEYFE